MENMKNDMLNWAIENNVKSRWLLTKMGSFCKEYGYTIIDIRKNRWIYDLVYAYLKKIENIKTDF